MDALQSHRVHETACVADDQRSIGVTPRNHVPTAFWQRLRAVANHLTAVEQRLYERMPLEMVERDVRIEHRILVVEAGDEPDRELTIRHRIDESAAEFLESQRIAHRVDDRPRRDAVRL